MRRLNGVMCAAVAGLSLMAPTGAVAEDFVIASRVVAATVFPQGAALERKAAFEVPAGAHELIIADMPLFRGGSYPRISIKGAVMGSVQLREDFIPPVDAAKSARIEAAREAVEAAQDQITALEDRRADALLARDGAQARIAFLAGLAKAEGAARSSEELRDLAGMIGEETLKARQMAVAAERAARDLQPQFDDLSEALQKAQAALAALTTEATDRAYLSVKITAEAATEGEVILRYMSEDAQWAPVYDIHLTRGDEPSLAWDRFAVIRQNTGSDWRDVDLTLSTARPSGQTSPNEIWPQLLRLYDPVAQVQLRKSMGAAMESDMSITAAPMPEAPVVAEIAAQMDFDGLNFTYHYPRPVSIANSADMLRLGMGQLDTKATLHAQAAPRYDGTAFLMAEFTNDTGEMILPGFEASLFLDGSFVGQTSIDRIAAGGEAALSFGPIDGLRLERRIVDEAEGDRGIISKSNRRAENTRLSVTNLTGAPWDMRVIDRVPYATQEDLEITWRASRPPTEQDIDGKRGVMAWEFALPAGASEEIELETVIKWPEGKELR